MLQQTSHQRKIERPINVRGRYSVKILSLHPSLIGWGSIFGEQSLQESESGKSFDFLAYLQAEDHLKITNASLARLACCHIVFSMFGYYWLQLPQLAAIDAICRCTSTHQEFLSR
jgi:hypothetical protein